MALDIDQSHYNAGSAAVAGVAVTGTGTAWLGTIRKGDIYGTHRGAGVRIALVNSNTSLTLAYAVTALDQADGPYEIQRTPYDVGYLAAIEDMIRLYGAGNLPFIAALVGQGVVEFLPGGGIQLVQRADLVSGLDVDERVETMPERAAFDARAVPFSIQVNNVGDGRAAVYFKRTDDLADWSTPAYLTGPVGPLPAVAVGTVTTGDPGTSVIITPTPTVDGVELDFTIPAGRGAVVMGDYNPGTAYVLDDAVLYNGSTWIAIGPTTGNAPPTLPTTSNAYWQLLARQGIDGAGTVNGVVAGTGVAVDNTDPTAPIISATEFFSIGPGLSLVQGVAIPTTDVAGATHVYVEPAILGGDVIMIPNATDRAPYRYASIDVVLSSSHNAAAAAYDVWVGVSSDVVVAGTGPAWTNSGIGASSRGAGAGTTEAEFWKGMWVNKNTVTVWNGVTSYTFAARCALLVGSFKVKLAGETEDSRTNRLVSSVFAPAMRLFERIEPAVTWDYSTTAWRLVNDNPLNQLTLFQCLSGREIELEASGNFGNSTSTYRLGNVGISKNSFTNSAQNLALGAANSSFITSTRAVFREYCDLGYTAYAWVEQGGGTDVQSWRGTASPFFKNGILGKVYQ